MQEFVPLNPVAGAAIFFVLYVATTALSIPGATILTLLGGNLFGFVTGAILVSFASTIGATIAMLTARYLAKDYVESKFSGRLEAINAGVEKDGALYLLSLRLIPAFPFFLVNLAVGMTKMPTRTFMWASQIGMLPLTLVYVYAGTTFASVSNPARILTAPILATLVALAILPFAIKLVAARLRDRTALGRWARPKRFDYNLVVIGAGSAGLVTSYIAAAAKAKVALIEQHEMGGDCLNTGCVPSKALIRSAKLASEANHAADYGLEGALETNFARVMARIQNVVAAVAPHDSVARYSSLGVEVIKGRARVLDPWSVEVEGRRLVARRIVLASGAEPILPPIPGLADVAPLTSETLWNMTEQPQRLLVVGGGAIGCELAQSFARLGSDVIVVEGTPRLMIREDEEVSEAARKALTKDRVEVLTGSALERFEITPSGKTAILAGGRRIDFDQVIVAVGRRPRISGFGLEDLGLLEHGRLVLDERFRTRIPTIFAAGDVAGQLQFTHAAGHYAWYAAMNSLFGSLKSWKVQTRAFPMVTFTDPEIARVGLNEAEAKGKGMRYEITRYELAELDRAITDGATAGFIKVLTVPGKDRILGATIVGARAGDMLGEFTLAMTNGLGLGAILKTIHPYPGWSEAAKAVSGEWRRAHLSPRLLGLSERFHRWMRG